MVRSGLALVLSALVVAICAGSGVYTQKLAEESTDRLEYLADTGNWTKEAKIDDATRTDIAKLHSQIAQKLDGCEIEFVKPLTFRSNSTHALVRTEIELHDDWDDEIYAHVKYEKKADAPVLVAIDNTVDEDSSLRDIERDQIEEC